MVYVIYSKKGIKQE